MIAALVMLAVIVAGLGFMGWQGAQLEREREAERVRQLVCEWVRDAEAVRKMASAFEQVAATIAEQLVPVVREMSAVFAAAAATFAPLGPLVAEAELNELRDRGLVM